MNIKSGGRAFIYDPAPVIQLECILCLFFLIWIIFFVVVGVLFMLNDLN